MVIIKLRIEKSRENESSTTIFNLIKPKNMARALLRCQQVYESQDISFNCDAS